uniref:Uncharacterized protein n=1 Tax=Caenorhabditis japonica TaxID=281687 RepID=A0A8R1ICL1_CAEJA
MVHRPAAAAYTHTHSADAYASLLVCVSPNGLLLAVTLYGTTGILPTVILGTHRFYSMYCKSILSGVSSGSCRTSRRLSYQRTADTSTPFAFREVLSSSLALGPRQL